MKVGNALKLQVSRSLGWLGMWLCIALLAAMILETVAADSAKPAYSSIPRVNRDLLLGFLADNSTLTLIDARSPEEFSAQHLPGAINIPFDAVEAKAALLPEDMVKPIVVYCRTGQRAGNLKAKLIARGYEDVRVLPREQIYWADDFMAFNCSTETATAATDTAIQPESMNEQKE